MVADTADCVHVMIEAVVFLVKHLLRRGEFDGKSAYPTYNVIFTTTSS
jgi:hypothetical protein